MAASPSPDPSPLLSIVVPVYNGAPFLASTLDSALAQTRRNWEMIIVDDGSTDDSADIAADYCRREPRLHLIRQPHEGVAAARNRGFAASHPHSDYVIFLDADDVWHPTALERLLVALEAHPTAAGAHAIARTVDEEGQPYEPGKMEEVLRKRLTVIDRRVVDVPLTAPTTFSALLVECWIVTPGICLLRRSFLERAEGFREALTHGEDWEFWLRLTRLGDLVFVDEVLIDYRRHERSASADPNRMQAGRTLIFTHLGSDPTLPSAVRWVARNMYRCKQRYHAARFRRAAREKFGAGERRDALRQFGLALECSFRALRGPRRGRK